MNIVDFLTTVPLFRGLNREQYDHLAMIATDQEYAKGQSIFAEGDPGEGFFMVMSGQVKIYKLSFEGKEQILHIFGPGEPFAEAAVFIGSPYPAHAMALAPSRVLFLPRRAFIELINRQPELALNMLAALSLRLKKFAQLIEELSLKEVPDRLAAHLLSLSDQQQGRDQVVLPVSKTQLAGLLGTIPETLSRIFNKMAKAGMISTDGPRITIQDREALDQLANGERKL
ncbi:Crp/Fnr family transcriptional regulator [Desulfurivibrio alkaliphilus]|uniref:Transcriptional regulator, Crp/Fnr family n=1 Tax=Desulfurivibrio alkaliphilus (strain DSM 19089 / UNIQEM U267 / AHT2) TaxID=589865 RepID=D6Z3X0_DESAT|nr:Crp/Fnr family transcriptional regulator [Desulfurivibrio alkaliphilus]ADH86245.1 transcriptional regulator, Crp/Fnr family [Desulfurivibrio alkaliphilus AHT 2]